LEKAKLSGPKIDHAEIERQQKAELERQRQEKLQKIRNETEKLNKEFVTTKTQIHNIDKYLSSIIRNIENSDEMAPTILKFHEVKAVYIDQLTKTLDINVPTEPDAISVCTKKLANATKTVMADFIREIKPLEERMLDFNKQLEIQNTITSISKNFSAEIENMKNIEDFDFSILKNNLSCSDIESDVDEKARQILSEIENYVNSESIQETDMKNLMAIANNIHKTAFETKNSFETAVIEYSITKASIVKNMIIFDELYHDYYVQYILWLDTFNENQTNQHAISPKEKDCFFSIKELENELKQLINETKLLSERNYIRKQINEVMEHFGYNIVEEIFFDTNQREGKNDCFDYIYESNSGQSAIHVNFSGEKRIMMEIIATDKNFAVPKVGYENAVITNSNELSNQERELLLQEQGAFCSLHPQIVEELRKRGVILDAKTRKKPHEKYSKKFSYSPNIFNENAIIKQSNLINKGTERRKHPKRKKKQHQKLQLRAMK